ncbi:MAG: tetratricopeptide repeat protein [Bacteroidetes bacterium]|nr:tetratricopeptide repeat protein [Bacteroidota bacterium]
MSGRNEIPASLSLLHARLRTARDDAARLRHYREFLDEPGDTPLADQLVQAGNALQLKGGGSLPIPVAWVYIRRARIRVCIDVSERSAALKDLDEAVACCTVGDASVDAAELLLKAAQLYMDLARPEAAVDACRGAAHICRATEPAEAVAKRQRETDEQLVRRLLMWAAACAQEGEAHLALQALQPALMACQQALMLREKVGRIELVSASLADLANVYAELGDRERAYDYLKRSLDAIRVCEEKGQLVGQVGATFEALAAACIALNKIDDAYEHVLRARAMHYGAGDAVGVARTHILAGRMHEAQARHNEVRLADAREEFSRAYRLLDGYRKRNAAAHTGFAEQRLLAAVHLAAGRIHRRQGDPDARFLLLDALGDAEAIGDRRLCRDAHLELHLFFRASKRHDRALEHYEAAMEIARTLGDEQHRRVLAELQADFDAERARRNEELLRSVQKENSREKNKLAIAAVALAQKNQLLTKLGEKLDRAARNASAHGTAGLCRELSQMKAEIEVALRSDSDWDMLSKQLEEIHPGVLRRLRHEYPAVTEPELKVCALTLLGLTAQLVAGALCLSPRTVQKHVQRIRAKMRLHRSVVLSSYLARLCENDE